MRNTALMFALPMVIAISLPATHVLALGTSDANAAHQYVSPWRTPWTYEGPRGSDHWAELDSQYAACSGKEQSPIDIQDTQKADLPELRFDYRPALIPYVTNNGATIRVNYEAPGSGDFLIVGDTRYQLVQFHFHRPSEERIRGKAYDMVLHLMHQSSDGKVVGVAVLLKAGRTNATIAKLWAHMPMSEGEVKVDGLEVNPLDLVPLKRGLLHLPGLADRSALQRRRHLVRAENASGNFHAADRGVRQVVSARCAAAAAAEWPHRQGDASGLIS